jgi:hypothetical protein
MECLCHFIVSLNTGNDVNLSAIAKTISRKASYQSCYRRLQRFINRLPVSFSSLWLLSQGLFLIPGKVTLSMDRTNWKFGKVHINFLVVAVIYKGVAIPLIWRLLPDRKRGNSNANDRIELFNELQAFFSFEKIDVLLCDREFIDHNWLIYLLSQNIPFIIRAKDNLMANDKKITKYFYNIKPGEQKTPRKPFRILGLSLFLSAKRLPDDELLIVVTNNYDYKALGCYALRWEIESFFSALKIRGYNFENTHITDYEKLSRLMFIVSIALLWAYRCGEIKELKSKTRIKKHGYKARAMIKNGIIIISKAIARVAITKKAILNIIQATFDPNIALKKRISLIGVV